MMNCDFSPNATPRDGNCLLHAILDGIITNDAFKHNDQSNQTEGWTQLLRRLKFYDANMDEKEHLQYLRNQWVIGASDWLSGGNGSKVNDKFTFGYSDEEWNFIWNTMVEDGAWDVLPIKDEAGNVIKENMAPEFFIKFIAHDLKCNIIVFDLHNKTVELCSGNQLLENNVEFNSPLLLYTTGSHFQSLMPNNHEFFIQYAKELECKYSMGSYSSSQRESRKTQNEVWNEASVENNKTKRNSEKKEITGGICHASSPPTGSP